VKSQGEGAARQLSSPADDALSHVSRQEQSRAAAYHAGLKWPIVAPNEPSVYFEEVSMPCFAIVAEQHRACRARLVEIRDAFCTKHHRGSVFFLSKDAL
jgi:hypothetical protein